MEETKKCPYCGKEILAVAKKCKHCGQWLEGKEKADIPVPTVEPSGEVNKNNDTKSPDKNKKNKWAIAAVLAVLLFGGYFYYNKVDSANRAEAALKLHQDSVAVFEKNAIEIKTHAKAIRKLSYLVFYDYYYNWRTAIFNNYAYNSNNKRTGCNDFNKALAWRKSFYEDQEVLKHLKTWQDEMTEKMRVCSVPPEEKHRVTLESLNDLYGKANETVNFCLNPKGNLRTFSDRYESLLQALDNSLSSSDVYINNIDEEAGNLYESAISWDINEYINNVLAK